jgi:hypothetical protein
VGVLYATGAREPVLVHIPLKLGVPGFRSSRDLEISYWVNQRDSSGRVSFGTDYTHAVHHGIGRRRASFTVFRENFMNLPPTNVLLGKLKSDKDAELEEGNVLVIKQPLRGVPHIDDMTAADIAWTSRMLRW